MVHAKLHCFCVHDYVVICVLCSPVCNGALCFACGYKSTQRQIKIKLFYISSHVCCALFVTSCKDLAFAQIKFAVSILIEHSALICRLI
jgi:hypothetical protein